MIKNGLSKIISLNDTKKKLTTEKSFTRKNELVKNYSFKKKKLKQNSKPKEKDIGPLNFISESSSIYYSSNNKINCNMHSKNLSKNKNNPKIISFDEENNELISDEQRKIVLIDSSKKIDEQKNQNYNKNQINKLKKIITDKKSIDKNIEKLLNNKSTNNNKLLDLLSPTGNNLNYADNNYLNTNPAFNINDYTLMNNLNNKEESKRKFSIQKQSNDKSCPKLSMTNNNQETENTEPNENENQQDENNNIYNNIEYSNDKKQISILNSIRGNLRPSYNMIMTAKNKNDNNLINILSPKNYTNINSKILKNKVQPANMNNKGLSLRKIKTINNKNHDNYKKDLTLNNVVLKKRRPRRFESEVDSKFIDSTNIVSNNNQNNNNKSSYMNFNQKIFNNSGINYIYDVNKKNVVSNKYINNNRIQKSNRDSKSVVAKNNNLNKLNKIININEPYLSNLFKMLDNIEQNRKNSLSKNKYDIKNKIYPYNYNKRSQSIQKSEKNEIVDNKIMENISQNTLTMYTLYLLTKNYKDHINKKIGLNKIRIYDINFEEIPIVCYNSNADYDNGKLFNTVTTNNNLIKNINNENEELSLITTVNKNININFYINNLKSKTLKFIKIFNYSNENSEENEEKVYPVKNIEIFKENIELFKGELNSQITDIKISDEKIESAHERPLSTSKSRTSKNVNHIPKSSIQKNNENNLTDKYHTARNNIFFHYNDNNENELNENNINDKNTNNNIINSINSNINRNTINIHINNNADNIANFEILENLENESVNEQKIYNNNQNFYYYTMGIPNNNSDNMNNINENINKNLNENNNKILEEENDDTILKTSINKKSNIALDKIDNTRDYHPTDIDHIEKNYSHENNSINNINFNINTNNNSNNFIEFNKIKFVLISNYGHKKYIGLTGIEFYNLKDEILRIETATAVGALPKDLQTIYNDENDERIFENVFNNYNNTNEREYMWVTKLKKTEPKTFIELFYKDKQKISRIKIYNYNEKDNLEICTKNIEIYLDDNYFNTITLNQGTGEIAFDFQKNDNCENDEEEISKKLDFGQDIKFPIKNINNFLDNENKKQNIKYASFLYEQNYETPFMPCGNCIKFEFVSNYYKGTVNNDDGGLLKYNDIGLDLIEIFNEDNFNIANKKFNKFKLLSNCEMLHENNIENKIIINGAQNEGCNNCLFYLYEENIKVTYIKFYPLTKNSISIKNSVKEVKIFCENKIIFEGCLYFDQPTVVLFTCDAKITKNINEKNLTKKIERKYFEEKNDEYISLVLN